MRRILEPGMASPPSTVGDVMTRDVATCAPDATLADAARIMWDHDCGFVPVVELPSRTVRGVVTDRDACMASLTQAKALCDLPVRVAMRPRVVTVAEGASLDEAHALMREHQIRRLPVVDAKGGLVGVLSLNDVATHLHDATPGFDPVDVATTLSELCRHRELVTP